VRLEVLRDFQTDIKSRIYQAWSEPNTFNVMPVAPTGSGKTVILGAILKEYGVPTCAIAHRQELVSQMSLALNRERVEHGIIAPKAVQAQIVRLHHETHGYSCYHHRAAVRVAGVDTLPNHDKADRWLSQVRLVVQDEGHHVLRENKWGKAMALFPNARGLFPTAHAVRADGAGLGRHADGLVDSLVVGPSCRELINRGFLTDYRLLCPSTDIDFSAVPIGSTGDYSLPKLRAATHESNHIVGDVVKHYLKYAGGKLGVTFAVDIEAAKEIASAYNAAGVPAQVITAKTSINVRGQIMRQFRNRLLLQLVSVDCLGEGVDVPAIEVVSMVRKTASFQLYAQQFGRSLRPVVPDGYVDTWDSFTDDERKQILANSTKPKAIIIDHVGNCMFHGLPDVPQRYSLDRRESRKIGASDAISLRGCTECMQPYERFLVTCPYCGNQPVPAARSTPQQVEGDLIELDEAVLQAIRGEIQRIDGPCFAPANAVPYVKKSIIAAHENRQQRQQVLRDAMALWGGWQMQQGRSERETQRLFYQRFHVDVLTAQTFGASEAAQLEAEIRTELNRHNVVDGSKLT
jgi:DNA repair protein RadD